MQSMAALIQDAVDCVAVEVPHAHRELVEALGDRRFEILVDDEHFMFDVRELPDDARVISVETDADTLCAIVLGELGAVDAVLTDRLRVIASADDVVAVSEAMRAFLQGALRCVSMRMLLDRLVALRKERM